MLSPLQERIARIIAGLSEAEDFALAGGGALIVRGDIDRKTRTSTSSDSALLRSTTSFP